MSKLERLKLALTLIVSAGCLVFAGWALATVNHRNTGATVPAPVPTSQEWGVHV